MTATERINAKEEFIKTRNGIKIQTITLPGKNIDQNNNQSEKHLIYFIGGNRALKSSKDYTQIGIELQIKVLLCISLIILDLA
uniref:hypothetical protein n=1 Tax=Wolbachia endosymbiont (group A) of Andrena hattorfiana TaxID=2953977 RepID=UPI0021F817AB|nr:hypothetical protein [Wolbachia endosymbiont (group A) of Andrena hattorfiana]